MTTFEKLEERLRNELKNDSQNERIGVRRRCLNTQ